MDRYSRDSNSLVNTLNRYAEMESRVSKIFRSSYHNSKLFDEYSHLFVEQLIDIQTTTSIMSNTVELSEMLKDAQMNLNQLNIDGLIGVAQRMLSSSRVSMPNMTYLKITNLIHELKGMMTLPTGLVSDIDALNKSSAVKLAYNDTISYNSVIRRFETEESYATSIEMNSICAAEAVFETISSDEVFTENDLMDFMSFLNDSPMMAMGNDTGRKIYEMINNLNAFINFDQKNYYHSRARLREEAPYVWDQMRTAPYGVALYGRYNQPGQAFFYFTDTIEGSEKEIQKHMTKNDKQLKTIQTAEIEAQQQVDLMDLSAKTMRGLNTFLKYIRFPLDNDTSMRPRVYLIPSFVASCCRQCGIDGIKYYGGKDYSNYVTWNDGYFRFIRFV